MPLPYRRHPYDVYPYRWDLKHIRNGTTVRIKPVNSHHYTAVNGIVRHVRLITTKPRASSWMCIRLHPTSSSKCKYTMAPNGSEFSQGVWISFFLFYLPLSLRNFMVFNCIVLMDVYMVFLRNASCRSNWKRVARMISQWFWCKYFAHNFILHSEWSKKNYRQPILD